MKQNFDDVLPIRNRFRAVCENIPGFEGLSITKDESGQLALAVHILEASVPYVTLPQSFEGTPVVVEAAGAFQLQ